MRFPITFAFVIVYLESETFSLILKKRFALVSASNYYKLLIRMYNKVLYTFLIVVKTAFMSCK